MKDVTGGYTNLDKSGSISRHVLLNQLHRWPLIGSATHKSVHTSAPRGTKFFCKRLTSDRGAPFVFSSPQWGKSMFLAERSLNLRVSSVLESQRESREFRNSCIRLWRDILSITSAWMLHHVLYYRKRGTHILECELLCVSIVLSKPCHTHMLYCRSLFKHCTSFDGKSVAASR